MLKTLALIAVLGVTLLLVYAAMCTLRRRRRSTR